MGKAKQTVYRLEPREEPFDCLGGECPESQISNIASTAYGRLERPPNLPPLSVKALAKLDDPSVRDVYLQLYNDGKFVAVRTQTAEKLTLTVSTTNDESEKMLMEVQLVIFQNKDITNGEALGASLSHSGGSSFYSSLDTKQADALAMRILHHCLRTHGVEMKNLTILCQHLYPRYGEKKRWKEALDIAMVKLDVYRYLRADQERGTIAMMLTLVAETLECNGRFQEAASVFEEVASMVRPGDLDKDQTIHLYQMCGLAHKRAENFAVAEVWFVKMLNLLKEKGGGNTFDMQEVGDYMALCMFMFYFDWLSSIPDEKERLKLQHELGHIERAMMWIVYATGYRPTNSVMLQGLKDLICQEGPYYQTSLKPSLLTEKGAKKALGAALSKPTNVEHFRSKILGCLNPSSRNEPPRTVTYDSERSDFYRTVHKQAMRVTQADRANTVVDMVVCAACGKGGPRYGDDALLRCPCKTVYYCTPTCQVNDWKKHKKMCSHHLEKKQKKAQEAACVEEELVD